MVLIEILITLAACAVVLPVLVYALQVFCACLPMREFDERGTKRPRIAVLVPAHDEAAVIGSTLKDLRQKLASTDRLLVVADNCTDDTAAIARSVGAEVMERTSDLRGKGYALDFGLQHLKRAPPDVLVIMDADCHPDERAIGVIAKRCVEARRPVQAVNLMLAPSGAGTLLRMSEFAWIVRNCVRPRGWNRLGLPCQLMGSGMAFPWEIALKMELANGSIVEDMKLGLDLAMLRHKPMFCPDVMAYSYFPLRQEAAISQRTRWEHGHLGMVLTRLPSILWQALKRRSMPLFAMGLDLAVPPLAMLVIMLVVVSLLTAVAAWLGLSWLPFWLSVSGLAIFMLATLVAWFGWGRRTLALTDLLLVPVYVVAKIPLYIRFFIRRQKEWVRTQRD